MTMPEGESKEAARAESPTLTAQLSKKRRITGDAVFANLNRASGIAVIALLVAMIWFVLSEAMPSLRHYGVFSFFQTRWAPSEATLASTSPNPYGIVQFIYGTAIVSFIAMVISVPIGVAVALFISEVCPKKLKKMLTTLTELLAAVPSVVYGFWGIAVLVPALRPAAGFMENWLAKVPGVGGFFEGPYFGFSILAASVVLSIMVLPTVIAISREVFATVPRDHREAAIALGGTRWEVIRTAVLPYSRSGVVGASFLGLGRALGETIAVTMVIGNSVLGISWSVLGQGATLASVIANEFTEANQPFHIESLFVAGFALMILTLVVNVIARVIVARMGSVAGRAS